MERRSGQPHTDAEPDRPGWTRDEFDALADLFLDDRRPKADLRLVREEPPRERPPLAPPATGDLLVEALVLGHLPVLASAWVGQYARARAGELGGPVALVRVQGGQASVEVVGDAAQLDHARDADPALASPNASLEGALEVVGSAARGVVVRVDEPDEPALLEEPRVGCVTVLTGADDAALVASYRTLKLLSTRLEAREDAPRVRVCIMGSPADKADDAKRKLDRTLATFQISGVEVVAGPHRIGAGASALLHRGASPGVARLIAGVPARARPARVVEPRACSRIGVRSDETTQPVAQSPAARTSEPAPPAPGSPESSTPSTGGLSRHLPGLTGIVARCPYAPSVELAVDSEGGLHLLAAAEGAGTPRGEHGAHEAVARLVSVAGWAFDHAELIRLASPRAPLSSGSSGEAPATVLHLLTDQPRDVRRLLESGVRVHQVSSVRVTGQTAWICRDLN